MRRLTEQQRIEVLERAQKLAAQGKTLADISHLLGISPNTLQNWRREHADVVIFEILRDKRYDKRKLAA